MHKETKKRVKKRVKRQELNRGTREDREQGVLLVTGGEVKDEFHWTNFFIKVEYFTRMRQLKVYRSSFALGALKTSYGDQIRNVFLGHNCIRFRENAISLELRSEMCFQDISVSVSERMQSLSYLKLMLSRCKNQLFLPKKIRDLDASIQKQKA